MGWSRGDVDIGQFWEKDGKVYKVIAIADAPTVTLRPVDLPPSIHAQSSIVLSDRRETHVIHSPNFARYRRLDPQEPPGNKGIA